MSRPAIHNQDSFRRDQSGSVAIIFALTALVVFTMVGGAIDYGRAVHARYQIQEAIDSAVLAGARVWQIENDLARAEDKARAHYQENKPEQMESTVTQFTPDVVNRRLSMGAAGRVPTPFLSIIGLQSYQVAADARAQFSSGGSAEQPVEVAMMLDVTQRMTGRPLQALQDAAREFVEILLAGGSEWARVALAPYAEGVRPGVPYFNSVVGIVPPQTKFEDINGTKRTYLQTACTAERVGNQAFTAAAPIGNDKLIAIYTKNGQCTPGVANPVTPLTSNKSALTTAIADLRAGGLNGGHIGVGWTWYLLSPDWGSVWPSVSRPRAYGSVQKVAILMTSGEWEVAYDASGVATRDSGRNPNNGASDTYSRQLCDNMKAAGIVVFSVGFALKERRAIENMKNCASDPSKFYNAEDGVALNLSYQDIALQIGKLKLIN